MRHNQGRGAATPAKRISPPPPRPNQRTVRAGGRGAGGNRGLTQRSLRRYEILNYQLMPNGTYAYVQIGDWNNGTLTLTGWPQSRSPSLVESVCSKPCPPGYYKVSANRARSRNRRLFSCCEGCGLLGFFLVVLCFVFAYCDWSGFRFGGGDWGLLMSTGGFYATVYI